VILLVTYITAYILYKLLACVKRYKEPTASTMCDGVLDLFVVEYVFFSTVYV